MCLHHAVKHILRQILKFPLQECSRFSLLNNSTLLSKRIPEGFFCNLSTLLAINELEKKILMNPYFLLFFLILFFDFLFWEIFFRSNFSTFPSVARTSMLALVIIVKRKANHLFWLLFYCCFKFACETFLSRLNLPN